MNTNQMHLSQAAKPVLKSRTTSIYSGPDFENPWSNPEGYILFQDRLPLEIAQWETIFRYVNENRPSGSPPMRLLPGPQLMAVIYDEIAAARAPGLTNTSYLFGDGIHPNELGNYYMELAHFAVIYERDPRGMQNLGGATPERPRWMQDLVWRVLAESEGRIIFRKTCIFLEMKTHV